MTRMRISPRTPHYGMSPYLHARRTSVREAGTAVARRAAVQVRDQFPYMIPRHSFLLLDRPPRLLAALRQNTDQNTGGAGHGPWAPARECPEASPVQLPRQTVGVPKPTPGM